MAKRHYLTTEDIEYQRGINRRVEALSPEPIRTSSRHRQAAEDIGVAAEYNGYFKVVEVPAEGSNPAKLKIIDGANPTGTIAGKTDVGDVPVATIEKKDGDLYLIAKYNQKYEFSFSYALPGSSELFGYILLASVSNGKLIQRYTRGFFYFNEVWVL